MYSLLKAENVKLLSWCVRSFHLWILMKLYKLLLVRYLLHFSVHLQGISHNNCTFSQCKQFFRYNGMCIILHKAQQVLAVSLHLSFDFECIHAASEFHFLLYLNELLEPVKANKIVFS